MDTVLRPDKPFSAIAAASRNNVIGNKGRIPWHLKEDFRWFKQTTMSQVLIMGRKTFDSIKKPLPDRETIVLTKSDVQLEGVRTVHSIDELFAIIPTLGDKKIFVAGGGHIYKELLPFCHELFLTRVKSEVEGDAYFPPFEHLFNSSECIRVDDKFDIIHYKNK